MKVTKFIKRDFTQIKPDLTLKKIEELMKGRSVKHVLVMEDNKLLGIISDRDVKKHKSLFAETKASKDRDNITLGFKAHQIMTRDILRVDENAKASEAVNMMLKNNISCIPVRKPGTEEIAGIITSKDILKWLVKLFNVIE